MTPKHPKIQAVLFDYGMVLSAPPNAAALQSMLDATGLEEKVFQQHYWAHRDDFDRDALKVDSYWKTVAEDAGFALKPETLAALKAADIRMWTDLNLPMVEWAQRLSAAGYRTGILSNIGDGLTPWMVENFAWLKSFHHLTWSWQLKLAKPDPGIYLHAAQSLGCEPREVLFIDDKEENLEAARKVGMNAALYSGHEEGGHAVFEHEMARQGFEELLTAAPAAVS